MSFLLIVFQGPSASGKSSLQAELGLPKLITWTSRPPRTGEVDGVDYHFTSREQLTKMHQSGRMLEISEYQGNLYGTSLDAIESTVSARTPRSVVLDASGSLTVKRLYPDHVLTIGVYAEEVQCRQRLVARGSNPAECERRLASYATEIAELSACDLIIRNTDDNRSKAIAIIQQFRQNLI
ncbi:MAG: guanylate kinase [Gorillibacterium sp.]|nr:guanylate kinase [Gorillibacterium sp.]